MSNSVFEVICPACGAEIQLRAAGEGWCRRCNAAYLVRLGHLIPIDRELHGAAHGAKEGTR
jgi:hypothetical protein